MVLSCQEGRTFVGREDASMEQDIGASAPTSSLWVHPRTSEKFWRKKVMLLQKS